MASASSAAVLRPLQVILPGNTQGLSAHWNQQLSITSELCWRGPALYRDLQKDSSKQTLAFGLGNESTIYSSLSVIDRGATDRGLTNNFSPLAAAVSPNDLEMFANTPLHQDLNQRIWTNIDRGYKQPPFIRVASAAYEAGTIRFMNFISKSFCENIRLERWGDFIVDDAARSMRRLDFDFADEDLTIAVVYLNDSELTALIKELKRQKGNHLLIQVPLHGDKGRFSTLTPERTANIWQLSLEPGVTTLPAIMVNWRNNGYPRISARFLPYDKMQPYDTTSIFAAHKKRISQLIGTPLKVIPPTFQASTTSFRFTPELHAHLMKLHSRADMAFIIDPDTGFFSDNIIFAGQTMLIQPNSRLRLISIPGHELENFVNKLIRMQGTRSTGIAGIEYEHFAGKTRKLLINGQRVSPAATYLLVTNEQTLADQYYRTTFAQHEIDARTGLTAWEIWASNLKTLKISQKMLYN